MTQSIQIYQSDDGQIQLEVALKQETVWLSQAQMAELFGTKRPAITKHLSNIFKSGELSEKCTCSILEHTTAYGAIEGKTQAGETYLLHECFEQTVSMI